MKRILGAALCCVSLTSSLVHAEPYNTFDIPGDFPGSFFIDFLGTEFLLFRVPGGSLSTDSQIQFDVVGPPTGDVWDIVVSPQQFQFVGFEPGGLPTPVFGAGTGHGTFDAATGQWDLDMPGLFVVDNSIGTLVDLHFTTEDPYGSRMVLDSSDPAWGTLSIVAKGQVASDFALLTLVYDDALIAAILADYPGATLDGDANFGGTSYEFRILGHDPIIAAPEPGSLLLVVTPLAAIVAWRRRRLSV